jgi:hypothetical protein
VRGGGSARCEIRARGAPALGVSEDDAVGAVGGNSRDRDLGFGRFDAVAVVVEKSGVQAGGGIGCGGDRYRQRAVVGVCKTRSLNDLSSQRKLFGSRDPSALTFSLPQLWSRPLSPVDPPRCSEQDNPALGPAGTLEALPGQARGR